MTTPVKTRVDAIRLEMARIRATVAKTTDQVERIALEEEIEDLRQDLIAALYY